MRKSQQLCSRKRNQRLVAKQKRRKWWDSLFQDAKRSYKRFRAYHQHEASCRMAARGFPSDQQAVVAKLLQRVFARRDRRITLGPRY